jgi:hypothetical protein
MSFRIVWEHNECSLDPAFMAAFKGNTKYRSCHGLCARHRKGPITTEEIADETMPDYEFIDEVVDEDYIKTLENLIDAYLDGHIDDMCGNDRAFCFTMWRAALIRLNGFGLVSWWSCATDPSCEIDDIDLRQYMMLPTRDVDFVQEHFHSDAEIAAAVKSNRLQGFVRGCLTIPESRWRDCYELPPCFRTELVTRRTMSEPVDDRIRRLGK